MEEHGCLNSSKQIKDLWAEHVAIMVETRYPHTFLGSKPMERNHRVEDYTWKRG
jgi:hypothetical protein